MINDGAVRMPPKSRTLRRRHVEGDSFWWVQIRFDHGCAPRMAKQCSQMQRRSSTQPKHNARDVCRSRAQRLSLIPGTYGCFCARIAIHWILFHQRLRDILLLVLTTVAGVVHTIPGRRCDFRVFDTWSADFIWNPSRTVHFFWANPIQIHQRCLPTKKIEDELKSEHL